MKPAERARLPRQDGILDTQVAIIGSGPAGLAALAAAASERHRQHRARAQKPRLCARPRPRRRARDGNGRAARRGEGRRAHASRGAGPRRHRDRVRRPPASHRFRRPDRRQVGDDLRPDRGHARPDGRARATTACRRATRRRRSSISGVDGGRPIVAYIEGGAEREIKCEFVAGCDGFHGVSRQGVEAKLKTFERVYPFGWLGVLSETPPVSR